ncbi:MAG: ThuA domain-containing protein [Verrucomicrobia bacterium]|nr:ThuA domain-containing protein [Verrucomicrobiota bacterium]MDA1066476.1 ThuA domain-containing protein [Verrucomicrobiota bacterium]
MKTLSAIFLSLITLFLFTACSPSAVQEQSNATRILIVVGPSNHAPGTHEVAAGARLIKYCLEHMENVPGFEADVVYAWSEVSQSLDAYASIVFIGDNFPGEHLADSEQAMKDISSMMDRGCGLVCVHYGVGLQNEDMGPDGDHPLLHWMGGYFAAKCDHHQSIARHYDATIEAADSDHPIACGWNTFTLREEPYINIYFGPDNNQLLPGAFAVATSLLPPENPKREIIAWGTERPDTGRGIGITMPHFYKNWLNEDLRKFILNSILWSAKVEVPDDGVQTTLPDLEAFEPESMEFVPKTK